MNLDFLDDALDASLMRQAQEHLETCSSPLEIAQGVLRQCLIEEGVDRPLPLDEALPEWRALGCGLGAFLCVNVSHFLANRGQVLHSSLKAGSRGAWLYEHIDELQLCYSLLELVDAEDLATLALNVAELGIDAASLGLNVAVWSVKNHELIVDGVELVLTSAEVAEGLISGGALLLASFGVRGLVKALNKKYEEELKGLKQRRFAREKLLRLLEDALPAALIAKALDAVEPHHHPLEV